MEDADSLAALPRRQPSGSIRRIRSSTAKARINAALPQRQDGRDDAAHRGRNRGTQGAGIEVAWCADGGTQAVGKKNCRGGNGLGFFHFLTVKAQLATLRFNGSAEGGPTDVGCLVQRQAMGATRANSTRSADRPDTRSFSLHVGRDGI
jgi:hypothetical protein